MHAATDEMAKRATFKGYGPEQGYAFLREAVAANDYTARGCQIDADEVFISDGSKCDCGNIQEIFAQDVKLAIPDPVYPVYVDTNVMAGRTGANIDGRYQGVTYLDSTPANGYVPAIPGVATDLIYLCFPNNPTGAVATRAQLNAWVAYAKANKAVILFDSAYESYIRDPAIPHSIYEIEGARDVAVEFRSFSKTAGFTGTRCAYTVVPKSVMAYDGAGNTHPLHALWNRRHTTKFNGVSYPIQKPPPPFIPMPANSRRATSSISTSRTRNSSAKPSRAGASPASAATTHPTSGSTPGATRGIFRPLAQPSPGRLHARRRFRQMRRRPRAHQRVQLARKCYYGPRPHQRGAEVGARREAIQ